MGPLEANFRKQLELYREQKLGVSKEKNVKKRLEKTVDKNDFQQQRGTRYATVKTTPGTWFGRVRAGRILGHGVSAMNGQIIGLSKDPHFTYKGQTRGTFGKTKVLSEVAKWTTSGFQFKGSDHSIATGNKKPENINKPKKTLKDRIFDFQQKQQMEIFKPKNLALGNNFSSSLRRSNV